MIMGDAIAVGKRPTERCQTFKVQAVSLNREKMRKKEKKGEKKIQKKKKKEEKNGQNKKKRGEKKTNQALPNLQSASCPLRQRAPLSLNQS